MEKIISRLMMIIFGIVMFFLTIISIVSTCFEDGMEHIYYIKDRPWLHLLVFFLVIGVSYVVQKKKIRCSDKTKKWIFRITMVAYGMILAGGTIYLAVNPVADQKHIVDIAKQMIAGDYHEFQKGGYLYMYNNQTGIIYLFYIIFKYIPGDINVIRILNVLSYIGSVLLMNKIGKRVLVNKSEYLVGGVYIAFVPLALYVPFIYGNLMGFFFSLLALEAAFKYLEKRNWKALVVLNISAALSVLIKQNYLIPVIGIFLFLTVGAIANKKIGIFIVAIAMACFVSITGNLVNVRMENLSGEELNQGMPATAWVAMGMQQTLMANGWFNSYNEKTYIENDCNPKKTNQEAIIEIKSRMSYFISHPSQLVFFYVKKDASQWNHPNFEGFWVNYDCQREKFDVPTKKVSGIIQKITKEPGSLVINEYLNIYQTIILLGGCAWIVLCRKKIQFEQLLLPTIVVGGFVFHTFWEGKSQYTITYYALLIPYGIAGYQAIVNKLLEIGKKEKSGIMSLWKNGAIRFVAITSVFLLICACIEFKLGNSPLCYEDGLYKEYLQQIK